MNRAKTITWLFAGLVGAIVLVGFFALRWGIWLPDVITRKTVVLDELAITNGDYFRLIQRWIGDGYLTEFQHTDERGRAWWFTIEGDAMKAWNGQIQKTDDKTIMIDVLGDSFSYDLQSHVGADRSGKPRWILEIPEDGSPAFVLGDSSSIPDPVTNAVPPNGE